MPFRDHRFGRLAGRGDGDREARAGGEGAHREAGRRRRRNRPAVGHRPGGDRDLGDAPALRARRLRAHGALDQSVRERRRSPQDRRRSPRAPAPGRLTRVAFQMGSEAPATLAPRAVGSTAAGLRAWIASGACQSENGAFVAWIDLATGRPSYDYPEITGYALTFLAGQASLSDDECSVGRRAAEWLVDRVRRGNLAARDGWDDDAVYLFDLAMIASGLLSFGRRVQVERYVEAGFELVNILADELASTEPISPVSARGRPSGRRGWSTDGRTHLAKLVQ